MLDARISHDLLLSIFHPTSPLHDGAVVQKDRVAAAQAFLPVTQSKNVSKFLGTRHRAGIGLTEETDAVVIIVSEERGVVSIAEGGTFRQTTDANELREQLQAILQAGTMPPLRPERLSQEAEPLAAAAQRVTAFSAASSQNLR